MPNTSACNELVYLTGMSLDKKRLNKIISEIDEDEDFKYWINKANQKTINAYDSVVARLAIAWNNAQESQKIKFGEDTITEITDDIIKQTIPTALGLASDAIGFANIFKKSLGMLAKKTIFADLEYFANQHPILHEILTNPNNNFNFIQHTPRNFFSVYLAHQSDAYTAPAFSQILGNRNKKFTWAYSDRDWYDNKFIDYVTIKVNHNLINEYQAEEIFNCHATEIALSKSIGEINLGTQNDLNTTFMSFYKNSGNTEVQDVVKSLAERNLFGINLLSQVLYYLREIAALKGRKITIKPSNHYQEPSTENERAFLEEVITLADDPCAEYDASGNDFEIIEASLSYSAKPGGGSYFVEDGNYLQIRIPLKIFISLPIQEFIGHEPKVSANILIPKAADRGNEQKILLTVGGAEHNRALAHLINSHRKQRGKERAFGFMDNIFDFAHKIKRIENHSNAEEHSFLMGINQPVSGFNGYLRHRLDDTQQNSSARDAKLLHFELDIGKNAQSKYRVIVLYGFSAVASKTLSCNVLAEFIRTTKPDASLDPEFIKFLFNTPRARQNGAGYYFRYIENYHQAVNKNLNTLAEALESEDSQNQFIKTFAIHNGHDLNDTLIEADHIPKRTQTN